MPELAPRPRAPRARAAGRALFLATLLIGGLGLAACDEQGPAERAGEKIDDLVNDKGPAERAGETIDDAVGGK